MADPAPIAQSYEPPHIERILTPEDLAHEVMYAGPGVLSLSDDQAPM
jgi:hypothetical protein